MNSSMKLKEIMLRDKAAAIQEIQFHLANNLNRENKKRKNSLTSLRYQKEEKEEFLKYIRLEKERLRGKYHLYRKYSASVDDKSDVKKVVDLLNAEIEKRKNIEVSIHEVKKSIESEQERKKVLEEKNKKDLEFFQSLKKEAKILKQNDAQKEAKQALIALLGYPLRLLYDRLIEYQGNNSHRKLSIEVTGDVEEALKYWNHRNNGLPLKRAKSEKNKLALEIQLIIFFGKETEKLTFSYLYDVDLVCAVSTFEDVDTLVNIRPNDDGINHDNAPGCNFEGTSFGRPYRWTQDLVQKDIPLEKVFKLFDDLIYQIQSVRMLFLNHIRSFKTPGLFQPKALHEGLKQCVTFDISPIIRDREKGTDFYRAYKGTIKSLSSIIHYEILVFRSYPHKKPKFTLTWENQSDITIPAHLKPLIHPSAEAIQLPGNFRPYQSYLNHIQNHVNHLPYPYPGYNILPEQVSTLMTDIYILLSSIHKMKSLKNGVVNRDQNFSSQYFSGTFNFKFANQWNAHTHEYESST